MQSWRRLAWRLLSGTCLQVVPIWKKEYFEDGQVWKENMTDSIRSTERMN